MIFKSRQQNTSGRTIAVITARMGSKRLPGKNLKAIGGKPLIAWTFECVCACRDLFYDIVLSTDDPEIIELADKYNISAPFIRPPELSSDDASSVAVLQHATNFVETRDKIVIDWILTLQPTSPLRRPCDIKNSIQLIETLTCDSLTSITESKNHPYLTKKIDPDGYLTPFISQSDQSIRRQDLSPASFSRNGAIYLTKRNILMGSNSMYGEKTVPYYMPIERSVDIDDKFDFFIAEQLMLCGKAFEAL
ncbi:cytidylyltransferase domain-containing protein [Polynucleobacter sp. Adler-ghost]|uniref:acylneuraminate cytidylyltransferase family protein n=1 Tax=Polynucleobacter sp. Adler-ghost TaxID=2770234 RepID=UPI001BFE16B7|nr:acylneuraminate cytidylyltransferase family protein [Polynucleobacter sp. Adler-ghost]QWE31034.1 acylneuraminate cytidylyltransferase family protein [Polynucleobacter sp. Adler-ghost]